MKRAFRKYHRWISLIVALPVLLTTITGILVTIAKEWSLSIELPTRLLLKVHTGEIFHLQAIYPILNGVGLIGLVITGLSMSRVFRESSVKNQ